MLTKEQIAKLEKDRRKYLKKAEARTKKIEALTKEAEALTGEKRVHALRRIAAQQYLENRYKSYVKARDKRISEDIGDKEWKRITKSEKKHRWYDRIDRVVRTFRHHNRVMDQGTVIDGPDGGKLENQGRIFLGGTKPMNKFVGKDGVTWLCKEAVTCLGTEKQSGALVSEAASKLQDFISHDSAIPCFTVRDENNGKVLASLQQRISVKSDAIDLFKWQSTLDRKLDESITSQILREHVTDWLLCNYDTKGENFLTDSDGIIRGIDKEQSFSYLNRSEAQHMSMDYSPNPNKTLYDTVFQQYAKGSDKVEINFQSVVPYIQKLEKTDSATYLAPFRDAVANKCGGDQKKVAEMEQRILARKDNIREEYRTLFSEVLKKRGETAQLDADGRFVFSDDPTPQKQQTAESTGFGRRPLSLDNAMDKTKTEPVRTEVTKQPPVREHSEQEKSL